MRLAILSFLCWTAAFAQAPVRILVAYHSQSGNTAKLASAIRDGAASLENIKVDLTRAADFKAEEIVNYDGIVVGTPIYWGNMSAETKAFLERIAGAMWKAKSNGDGRTAAAFCTGGGKAMGKDTARAGIISALMVMRYLIVGGVDYAGFGTLGPEATTGETDPGISDAETREARTFGERFAKLTKQLRTGR